MNYFTEKKNRVNKDENAPHSPISPVETNKVPNQVKSVLITNCFNIYFLYSRIILYLFTFSLRLQYCLQNNRLIIMRTVLYHLGDVQVPFEIECKILKLLILHLQVCSSNIAIIFHEFLSLVLNKFV